MGEELKPKHRPVVRLGLFLISHSCFVSFACCTVGLIALLLLPVLAKNTYISENSLMPGSANSMLSNHDVAEANRLIKELSALDLPNRPEVVMERRMVISKYMLNLGAEVNYHKFHPQTNQFGPLRFFSGPDSETLQENLNRSICGVNSVGIIRAPRGDGKEAIVLVTPYNVKSPAPGEDISLSVGYAVFALLSRVTWLAKDIIWLITDSQFGDYTPVNAWLREYHAPSFSSYSSLNQNPYGFEDASHASAPLKKVTNEFRRAGTMAAALVLKVAETNEEFEDSLSIFAEASNGQMPNLDLINVVNYLAVHRQGLRVKIEKFLPLMNSKVLKALGYFIEVVGKVLESLNPQWSFGIPASDFVDGTATLASSMYRQALGIPTGPHGAFRDFQVDAVTMLIVPKKYFANRARLHELTFRYSRLIESVVRSINNLLEKFHQSFFLYLLTSPGKFVSVGVYMIAFAVMVAPLPLAAASLYCKSKDLVKRGDNFSTSTLDELNLSNSSFQWQDAAKEVLMIHIWGLMTTLLLPYVLTQNSNETSANSFVLWTSAMFFQGVLLYMVLSYNRPRLMGGKWLITKSVTISAAFIGLLLMSVVNYATAQIGSLLIVPLCLVVRPWKVALHNGRVIGLMGLLLSVLLGFIAFPPAAFFLLKWAFDGSSALSIEGYWNWMSSLWTWNSATYIYLGMVHLPCLAMCLHILFLPS